MAPKSRKGYFREWQRRPDVKRRRKEQSKRWQSRDKLANRLGNIRARAREKGLEFTLTREDIIVPERCPILGIPLAIPEGRITSENHWYFPSVDRKDNAKGYIPENIWIISKLANTMKSEASPEFLRKFAKWVLKEYGE